MTQRSVLVVTRLDDTASNAVIDELNSRGVPVIRIDPGDFLHGGIELAASYGPEGGPYGVLASPSRRIRLESIRSVYYRRPSPYGAPSWMSEEDARFAVSQAQQGLGGVLGTLGCRFVNHPWQVMRHEHKAAQLAAASAVGFRVLPTLVTNSLATARKFAAEHGPVVYKPLAASVFTGESGQAEGLWAEIADPGDLDEGVALTAHQFQAATPGKVADVRVTAIGGECFAVRIDSSCLDFRRDYNQVSYSVFDLPSRIAYACRSYLEGFGLLFGAFDFGLRADGSLDFYECNGVGQWHWLEEETGLPMTSAIADLLEVTG